METVKERTERKTGLDYKLKIEILPEELNGTSAPVMEEDEFEIDNYRYSISREELHERIERGRQEIREGKTILFDDAYIERKRKLNKGSSCPFHSETLWGQVVLLLVILIRIFR